jgi:hypothetical protein
MISSALSRALSLARYGKREPTPLRWAWLALRVQFLGWISNYLKARIEKFWADGRQAVDRRATGLHSGLEYLQIWFNKLLDSVFMQALNFLEDILPLKKKIYCCHFQKFDPYYDCSNNSRSEHYSCITFIWCYNKDNFIFVKFYVQKYVHHHSE